MAKRFSVFVNGENFFLEMDDTIKRYGFYTEIYVYALNEKDAERQALEVIRKDPKLRDGILNDKSDPPKMFIEKITETDSSIPSDKKRIGYAFYEEEDQLN